MGHAKRTWRQRFSLILRRHGTLVFCIPPDAAINTHPMHSVVSSLYLRRKEPAVTWATPKAKSASSSPATDTTYRQRRGSCSWYIPGTRHEMTLTAPDNHSTTVGVRLFLLILLCLPFKFPITCSMNELERWSLLNVPKERKEGGEKQRKWRKGNLCTPLKSKKWSRLSYHKLSKALVRIHALARMYVLHVCSVRLS